MALRREDFETYGYTQGCSKCAKMSAGHSGQGYTHSAACRFRLEKNLEEADDQRLAAAKRRYFEALGETPEGPQVSPRIRQERRLPLLRSGPPHSPWKQQKVNALS